MADTKSVALTVGIFIILAATGTVYLVNQGEKVYFCESTQVVGICEKLSTPVDGVSTRCYYNVTKYKTCTSGWVVYDQQEITGEIDTTPEEPEKKPAEPIDVTVGSVVTKIDPNLINVTDEEVIDAGAKKLEEDTIKLLSEELQYEISKPIIAKDITRLKEALESIQKLNAQYTVSKQT